MNFLLFSFPLLPLLSHFRLLFFPSHSISSNSLSSPSSLSLFPLPLLSHFRLLFFPSHSISSNSLSSPSSLSLSSLLLLLLLFLPPLFLSLFCLFLSHLSLPHPYPLPLLSPLLILSLLFSRLSLFPSLLSSLLSLFPSLLSSLPSLSSLSLSAGGSKH